MAPKKSPPREPQTSTRKLDQVRTSGSGVDQGLRANDASCPPGAVDDDGRAGIFDHFGQAVGYFATGQVYAARYVHIAVFAGGPDVNDNGPDSGVVEQGLDLAGGQARRFPYDFNVFTKALAQGADPVNGDKTRVAPRLQPSVNDVDSTVAHGRQGTRGAGTSVEIF